jgi:hypothetical protein
MFGHSCLGTQEEEGDAHAMVGATLAEHQLIASEASCGNPVLEILSSALKGTKRPPPIRVLSGEYGMPSCDRRGT